MGGGVWEWQADRRDRCVDGSTVQAAVEPTSNRCVPFAVPHDLTSSVARRDAVHLAV